jgi:sulfite oxidase
MSTHREQMAMHNRPDEWKIEQGIHGASLPILDQSSGESRYVKPFEYEPFKDEAAIKAVGNPDELFAEEREGWSGYVEWENYPEKKEKANKILTSQNVCMTICSVCIQLMYCSVPASTRVSDGSHSR